MVKWESGNWRHDDLVVLLLHDYEQITKNTTRSNVYIHSYQSFVNRPTLLE